MNVSYWRGLALVGYFGLMLTLIGWILLPEHSDNYPVSALLLFGVMPLLFPLRGLLHGNPYTHAWASYLVLVYFAHGIAEWYASSGNTWFAILEVIFSSVFFVSAMVFIKTNAKTSSG